MTQFIAKVYSIPSPWLKKILKFDHLKQSRMTKFKEVQNAGLSMQNITNLIWLICHDRKFDIYKNLYMQAKYHFLTFY